MNANELADLIGLCGDGGYNQDAATMLRQQQAEIEALKSELNRAVELYTDKAIENEALRNQLWDLKSEPWGFDRHPVKELTDEEITACIDESEPDIADMIRFARAILRKAQEK